MIDSGQMTITGRRVAVGLTWSEGGFSAVIWTIKDGEVSHLLCDASRFPSVDLAKEAAVDCGIEMLTNAGENERHLTIN